MSYNWRKGFEIVWHGETPPEGTEAKVREDMVESLWGLSRPSHLTFHTVFLDDDNWETGPTVSVWGERRDKRFHAEYSAVSEWVPISALEDAIRERE